MGNQGRLMVALSEISQYQPDVVITPECYLDVYIVMEESITREDLAACAVDPENFVSVDETAAWAEENKSWLILGCMRKTYAGTLNSFLISDRQGNLAGIYDKTHYQRRDKKFIRVDRLPVFDSNFGKFGVLICVERTAAAAVAVLPDFFGGRNGAFSDRVR